MDIDKITTVGKWQYRSDGEASYRRRAGTLDWSVVETDTAPIEKDLSLTLIFERQAEGEPNHWSLFVAREGESGCVYQVKGDAEQMKHEFANDVNMLNIETLEFVLEVAILTDEQAASVGDYARREVPPSAPNRAAVMENYQGWTVRVLENLATQGIVPIAKLETIKRMVEPI